MAERLPRGRPGFLKVFSLRTAYPYFTQIAISLDRLLTNVHHFMGKGDKNASPFAAWKDFAAPLQDVTQ